MEKRCCGSGGGSSAKSVERDEHAENAGDEIFRVLGGVMRITGEMEKELSKIDVCPEPCGDGTVKITIPSGQRSKHPCPVLKNGQCGYANYMKLGLQEHIESVMAAIGIPLRHIENFSRLIPRFEGREAEEWPARGFLIVTGAHGTGKSFRAARAVFGHLKRQVSDPFDRASWENAGRTGNAVMWKNAADLADDWDAAARVKNASLAVIDDLGGESGASPGIASLRGVILRRYDMKLPTVITTVLTMPDIAYRYGSGIADRLTEDMSDGGKIIDCGNALIRNAPGWKTGSISERSGEYDG